MASDGTAFTIDLPVHGAGAVDAASASLDTLAAQLERAGGAATAAADAVKGGETSYARAEAAADRAAKAVEKIGVAIDAQRGKMSAAMEAGDPAAFWRAAAAVEKLTAAQGVAAGKAASAKAAVDAEAASLDQLKASAAGAAEAQAKIAKAHTAAKAAAVEAAKVADAAKGTGKVNEMAEGLGKLGGPLGRVGQQAFGAVEGFKKLGASMGQLGPYVAAGVVIAAVAAGLAVLGVAAVAAVAKVTIWAVGLADAARTAALLSDGIAGTVKGGRALDATIDRLGRTVPQTRDELMAMAADIAKTGVTGKDLDAALESAAIKAAKLKWGPDFAKQMTSLEVSSRRLKAGIASIFGGLKIDALLEAWSRLVGLFDATESSGNAIKVLFESMFQPVIDGLAAVLPKAITTFIQIEIMIMKAAIAIKPYGSKLLLVAEAFGVIALVVGGVLAAAMVSILVTFTLLATAVGVVASLALAMAAAFVYLAVQVATFASSLATGATEAWAGFRLKLDEGIAALRSMSLREIGDALMRGLVEGIKAGAESVKAAVTGSVQDAVKSAKGVLGIKSPSTVMASVIGEPMSEGIAAGVDRGAGSVSSALESAVTPPSALESVGSGGATKPAPATTSGGGAGLNLAGATFNLYGVEGAADAEARIGALLTRLMEGDVAQLGAAVPVT